MATDEYLEELADRMWERWRRMRIVPKFTRVELTNLLRFIRENTTRPVSDVADKIDPDLPYGANLEILTEELAAPPMPEEERLREIGALEEQAARLRARVLTEEEFRRLGRIERELERLKGELERERAEKRRLEERLKAAPPAAPPPVGLEEVRSTADDISRRAAEARMRGQISDAEERALFAELMELLRRAEAEPAALPVVKAELEGKSKWLEDRLKAAPPEVRPPRVIAPPPERPPAPAAPAPRAPPPRERYVELVRCTYVDPVTRERCPNTFELDVDLMEKLTTVPSPMWYSPSTGVTYEPLLRMPLTFFHYCPEHRNARFGYYDPYDLLAYMIIESERQRYGKLNVTYASLRRAGLDERDIAEVRRRVDLWRSGQRG